MDSVWSGVTFKRIRCTCDVRRGGHWQHAYCSLPVNLRPCRSPTAAAPSLARLHQFYCFTLQRGTLLHQWQV